MSEMGSHRSKLRLAGCISIFAVLLLLGLSSSDAQTADLVLDFEIHPATILKPGAQGTWDATAIYHPFVLYQDGRFHMFYTGFPNSNFTDSAIGYATSPDGLQWTKYSGNPILRGNARFPKLQSPAVLNKDGEWVMYLQGDENVQQGGVSILRASAPRPEGPWKLDDRQVYGTRSSIWNFITMLAGVFPEGDGYRLFFSGWSTSDPQIGTATSLDGIAWEFYNDPATSQPLYFFSDPVLRPGGADEWDRRGVATFQVLRTASGYETFYAGYATNPFVFGLPAPVQLGYATSEDGVHWVKYKKNPVINSRESYWLTIGAVVVEGVYYLFTDKRRGRDGIGLIKGTIQR